MRKLDKALGQKSLRISVGYLEDMWGIAGRYLGDILGYIGDTYLGDIARGVSGGYLGNFLGISGGSLWDIMGISPSLIVLFSKKKSIFAGQVQLQDCTVCFGCRLWTAHCLRCGGAQLTAQKRYKEPMSFGSNSNCFSALKVKKQKGGDST